MDATDPCLPQFGKADGKPEEVYLFRGRVSESPKWVYHSAMTRFQFVPLISLVLLNVAHAEGLAVEIIEFKGLRDPSRQAFVVQQRPRLFGRRHRVAEVPGEEGRSVPIKVHAPVAGGPYPLVLMSHGAGGSWDGHYAVAQYLASKGYIVLCLEHTGSNTARLTSSLRIMKNMQAMIHDSTEVLARPRDVSFAIDRASEWNRSHPRLRGRMDLARVGVLGHSFGAYTVLALAGARPALDWLEPKVAPGKGLGPDLSDPRILCGVALSPQSPGEPFFHPESFRTLKVPVLGISGTEDQQSNGNSPIQRREAFKLWPEMAGKNAFVWITRASHMDFSDSTGSDLKRRESSSRQDVQRVVRAASLAFFERCLKSKVDGGSLLSEAGLKPQLGGSVTRVEVLNK